MIYKLLIALLLSIAVPAGVFAFGGGTVYSDESQIDDDEEVTFFPSYGYYDSTKAKWVLNIEGWIREPTDSSILKATIVGAYELFTGTYIPDEDEFWRRVKVFASDNESGEKITIKLGGNSYKMPSSSGGGRIVGTVVLSQSQVNSLSRDADGLVSYTTTAVNGRIFNGKVQLISQTGVSVISDIDDTIKISGIVEGTKTVIYNTFIKNPPVAAPGMSKRYRDGADIGWNYHYLTGSPWQLNSFLEKFRTDNQFPVGSFNMKEFRVNITSSEFWGAVAGGGTIEQKKEAVAAIVGSYPQRTFYLIGDSGEKDPEIYAWAANNFGDQIVAVYIRNVTDEHVLNERLNTAFGANIEKVTLIDPETGEFQSREIF